ncbi:AAA domain-containing protein [Clostridium baratii]|uniref:AAA domain-containing protein n=1 Tax=Clostridium baratii TaxID=1561 RepID=UPI001CB4EC5E|nr:AAA domain-containing protein [Clostridium baratii]STB00066.1 DNA/RNA helicase, superfamily I [Clostridium baratii]
MNAEENLILIKEEDQTEKIIWCKRNAGKYDITFKNNKTYHYNFTNVLWVKKTKEINPEITILYEGNNPITGIKKIIQFEDFIKVWFKNNYKKVYKISNIRIEESNLNNEHSKNIFEYLKELSKIVSIQVEYDSSILRKAYERINTISPNSVLSSYLSNKSIKKLNNNRKVIFPFGCNLSQREATEKALTNQISVIEGPPGTGKTQTILNIIANALIRNKTVAVVSNNNSATANVLEKLEKYGLSFICAYLGNNDNKDKFFDSQELSYPNMQSWYRNDEKIEKLIEELKVLRKNIDIMLDKQNKLAKLKEEQSEVFTEIQYFKDYYDNEKLDNIYYKSIYNNNSDSLMKALVEYEFIIENKGNFKLINKIRNLFKYGIISFKFYNNSSEDILDYLKNIYYNLKINEVSKEIEILEKELERFDFENSMKEFSEISMDLFKARLFKKFGKKDSRQEFSKDCLWKNSESFLNEYPVILSTTHSLRSCVSENYLFDYVIIDEASQVDIVTGGLVFSCAKNAVIVGDLKQLPNVVTDDIKKRSEFIFEKFNLSTEYKYENSLLLSIVDLYKNVPRTLLKEHYRCHPKIIGFCNKKFYNGDLIVMTKENINDKPLKLYRTVKGNHARGKYNQRQIDVVLNEVIPNIESNNSIGIVSPYREQVTKLKEVITDKNIEVDTVHKYQGREMDSIILTTVANEINDFIDDENLINVAVSRAVKELAVVISDNISLDHNSNISDLIKYIKYNNFDIIDSKIYSVFDLLYKDYSDKLLELMSKNKKVSEYDSENLINNLLDDILREDKFNTLDKVMHQPLRMLVRDTSLLNEIEYKFLMNPFSHTDFVIFNNIDKSPVLVVEVDGYKYHENNKKQLERDKIKDSILNKYGIEILRLKTNESREKERISNKLISIMN